MTDPNPDPGTDPKDTDPGQTDPTTDPLADPPEDEDDDPPTVESLQADLAKATKDSKRRDRELRKAQAELATLKAGTAPPPADGDPADDPVVKANRRLVAASAQVELATVGVAREDMPDVLEVLNLTGIDVDDDGIVDAEAVAERIETLRKVFAGTAAPRGEPRRRTPRASTRDRGGDGGTALTEDQKRWRRVLGHRG